ncbi:hypothetical protein BGAL_0204g00150 [Botrytis galanthina]|uniref:Major facilitator superfamily (MFS) profile domain-containing protein n=1 Tax=Botrytis galanthina TaxID=278940 RepID=A0A4S8QWC5_9HELO|nr:hypothetical protein BGAL_0204g00150 [Botrytis galanthina]
MTETTSEPTAVEPISTEKIVEHAELPSSEQPSEEASDDDINGYVEGAKLYLLTLSLSLCMLIGTIELTVISTSLTSITNDLHGFNKTGWIVTGYLVTYSSTFIIWSKLSDVFGRKSCIITSVFIFVIFSGGCGAAQTITQLIVCRVFQGIGAAGDLALVFAISFEMIPKAKFPTYTAIFAVVTTLGYITGPLIGGGFAQNSTWRWAFLFNVPVGALAIVLLIIFVPSGFPHQNNPNPRSRSLATKFSRSSLAKIDGLGVFLFLGASFLLVTVLLSAGNDFAWKSATTIVLFIISGFLWIAFAVNEWFVTNDKRIPEPIFPWRFVLNRKWMGALLLSLLSGIPWNAITINLPQRLQVVNGMSPVAASVRLIPFTALIAFGSVIANVFLKLHVPPIYLMFIGSCLQVIGVALLSTVSKDTHIDHAIYGYEVIAGLGIGIVIAMIIVVPPHVVEKRDLAISSGALLQFRALGAAIGLGITSATMNNYLSSHLTHILTSEEITQIFHSISSITTFPPEVQLKVLHAFADGYQLQIQIMAAFSGLQVLLVAMFWEKPQVRV